MKKNDKIRLTVKVVAAAILCLLLIFCVSAEVNAGNWFAKNWGGTTELELPEGMKLLEVTWKDEDSLWYLVRPMRDGEKAEEYQFQESSQWGIIEGTVILKEKENTK